MPWTTGAWVPLRCLIRVGLQPPDKFAQVLRWYRLPCDNQISKSRDQRDRLEIVQQVVLKRIQGAVPDVRVPGAEAQRVSVRPRAGDPADADNAVCASYIFNHDGLTE